MRYRIFLFLALVPFALGAQNVHKTVVTPQEGECWWGAVMNKGYEQPYCNFSASDNYYLDDKSRPARGQCRTDVEGRIQGRLRGSLSL